MDTKTRAYRAVINPKLWVEVSADVADNRVLVTWSFLADQIVKRYLQGTLIYEYKDRWIPEKIAMEVANTVKSTLESAVLNNDALKESFEKRALRLGFTEINIPS